MQERVLIALAGIEPPWTLTGGGALVGFHTMHRETRDLDLVFRNQRTLGPVVEMDRERLERDRCAVTSIRTSSTFSQLDVRDGPGSVLVDLVADPTPIAVAPQATQLGGHHHPGRRPASAADQQALRAAQSFRAP